MSGLRILWVGNDDAESTSLRSLLSASTTPSFQVEHVSNGWDAHRQAADGAYDAMILEDHLSDVDADTLLARLRASGIHGPAMVLTSSGSGQSRSIRDDGLQMTEALNGSTLVRALVALVQQHALNTELVAAREQAARSEAALAALAHDLATPLGVIVGLTQILLSDDYGLNADGRECLEDVVLAATNACERLKRLTSADAPAGTPSTDGAIAYVGTAPSFEAGTKLVLIADDDPATRRLVRMTLASDRYSVLEATDGKEAWRLIRDHHPAVAILDWQMPVYSGLELTDVIKSDPQVGGMTVIMLTGRTTQEDREAGARARADLYVTKPFLPQELLEAVEKALGIT